MGAGRTRVLLAIALLLFGGIEAGGKTKGKTDGNELAMELYDGYLTVVEGSIGDLHGLKFLMDTGATSSAIDRKVAERLGLPLQPGKVINFDKSVRVEWSEVPELAYGPEHVSNAKVMVEDLQYFRAIGIHLDGVIGWDLLRRESFRLDFARKRIVFGATEQSVGRAVPMRADARWLTVQVQLGGRSLWMIADTGMLGTMFYEGSLGDVQESYPGASASDGKERGWRGGVQNGAGAAAPVGQSGSEPGSLPGAPIGLGSLAWNRRIPWDGLAGGKRDHV